MAGIQYGTENPRAIEPFSIESTLAPLAVGGNANAQTLLQQYHLQNQVAQDQYLDNLASQHEVARQQIAAQMAEARMKEAPNWAKAPGLARLMYSQGFFPGLSADDVSPSVGQAETAIAATNLKDAGQGFNQFSQGGYQFADPNAVPGSPGGIATNLGPAMVQSEKIKAAVDMARIAANAGGAGITTSGTYRNPATGQDEQWHAGKGVSDAAKLQWLRAHGVTMPDAPPPNQPLPGQSGGGTATAPTGTLPGTNLPYAQVDTPANTSAPAPSTTNVPSAPPSTQNTAAGSEAVRQGVLAKLPNIAANSQTKPIADDIRTGMAKNGGMPIVQSDGKGGFAVIGGSGHPYPW